MSASYFQELIRLREVSKNPLVYQSVRNPAKAGNTLPISYGGLSIASSIQAAFHSLPEIRNEESKSSPWAIYSANGLFLGPTLIDRPVQYTVTLLRDTRTFVTRFIVGSQKYDGKARNCFCITIDFTLKTQSAGPHHNEAKLPLSFSCAPSQSYPPVEELGDLFTEVSDRVKRGELDAKVQERLLGTFALIDQVSTLRNVKGGIIEESVVGILRRKGTPYQVEVPDITKRRNVDYFKARETLTPIPANDDSLPLNEEALQASYLAFLIDGALAFYPLIESGMALHDAGACSTLDFAIRYHDDETDYFNNFHLREMRTYCASRERTFNEALIWDLDGKLTASVSQQCVLRPKKASL